MIINCFGDSITEGMAMQGHHKAEYGEGPYPAKLKKLLIDNGYAHVEVRNYGHGGERIPDIVARLGAFPCYFKEDVVIDAENNPVGLGEYKSDNGRVTGTRIALRYADEEGKDYDVYFTQLSHDTNPVHVDGQQYTFSIENNQNFIHKAVCDGKCHVIKKGTRLSTNNDREGDINIIFGGVNDGAALTLKRFLNSMEACLQVNGGKGIVIGSTHAIFRLWNDLTGTLEEKYMQYKKACFDKFGLRFVDLYEDFFKYAMDYALKEGYFEQLSKEQISEMRGLLEAHIIPAEFSFDKKSQGNVHLSEEGYHVIAKILFKRLKELEYI